MPILKLDGEADRALDIIRFWGRSKVLDQRRGEREDRVGKLSIG